MIRAGTLMEFLILGPLEVRAGDGLLPLGGAKQRGLLAILLLHANRVVARDLLIEELWPGQDPAAADHALSVQVSRLRKVLAADGGSGGRLETRTPGYMLRVEPGELDLERFERVVAEARSARAAGDHETAARNLAEAETLWRGRALSDLEFEPFLRVDVERLEELRLSAIEDRVDAELALGRHDALVGELEVLVSRNPVRERLREQLMLALYRAGRQAEALEVYRDGRALLVEQLGLDPSPRLQELERAILRQDAALHPDSAVAVAALPSPSIAPPPEAPRNGRADVTRRRGRIIGGLAGVVAAAVAVAVLVGGNGESPGETLHGNAVAVLSPGGRISNAVALPAAPTRLLAAFGSLWVTQFDTGRVSRIDPGDRAANEPTIRVGSGPAGLAVGSSSVWVANSLDGTVSRIDATTNDVVQWVSVGSRPTDVAAGDGSVWVANAGDGTVSHLDGRTGRVVRTADVGGSPTALALGAGSLWVATGTGRSVVRLDPQTDTVIATIGVGGDPADVAVGAGGVWVANALDGTVSTIDPERDTVSSTIRVGDGPAGVAVDGSRVWVANQFDATLSVIDARRRRTIAAKATDGEPVALAAGDGRLWVGVRERASSHRGGQLVLLSEDRSFGSIDPAIQGGLSPAALLGMTNDGLVTFAKVDGSAGAAVVPDLAVSLPVPTDNGRRYTFRLRPGIRYSTGQPVRARDVRHSLERVFRLRSPWTPFYGALVGAPACLRHPVSCDLSGAVVTDDRRRVVTFLLRKPDPEFLYEIALPYAYVVPSSTPLKLTGPVPGTGPYRIASYRPGHALTLVRNRRFHEWSRVAQPDGYPDSITWRLGVSPNDAVDAILRGRADWMYGFGELPRDRRREIETRHASQVHVHSTLATDYLIFYTRRPPFDDVRVRRAVNYAIDRRAVVRLYGGPRQAAPTCQVLPPQMPGYHAYCPYSAGPGRRRWRAPDLARARRLVAASGTRGARVVVLDSTTPQIFRDEGRLAVATLRRLGYRATLKLLPDDVYNTVASNQSKVRSNMTSGGWGADYPAASNFTQGLLTCSGFRPHSDYNRNSGGFCDHRLDHTMDRARALQVSDPPRANALWARIDHEIVDRAAWLPLVTPTNTDVVSTRVGNYRYHPLWGVMIDQLWVR
jgi:YVTN family beta-propeller protein